MCLLNGLGLDGLHSDFRTITNSVILARGHFEPLFGFLVLLCRGLDLLVQPWNQTAGIWSGSSRAVDASWCYRANPAPGNNVSRQFADPLLTSSLNDRNLVVNMIEEAGFERTAQSPYSAPRPIASADECYFYHTMDVPGHGTIQGEWDLRGSVDKYLGNFDFKGKRVLDVGAASGILSFHIEKQGAEVVSFDLSENFDWDIVPFAENDNDATRSERRSHLRKINNGYWLCHKAFGSNARMVNGVVYDIPQTIGPVDVAVFGSILLHLRDPFLALENAARLTKEAIIVSDLSPYGRLGSKYKKSPRFMPKSADPGGINDGWFRLPPLLVQEYLGILGFKQSTLTWNSFKYGERTRLIYTIIAQR